MTRDEDVIIEAKKYYRNDIKCYDAFLHGVEWADAHPINVWHDASEEPKGVYQIMCQDKFAKYWMTDYYEDKEYNGKGWKECVECECIIRWAYISDLLPKGGEK